MKQEGSKACSDDVGKKINHIASSAGNEVLLKDFGESTKSDTDENSEQNGSFPESGVAVNELFAIAPKAHESEGSIHDNVCHLVEPDDGLDSG